MVEATSLIFIALGAGVLLVVIALILYFVDKNKNPGQVNKNVSSGDSKKVTQTDKLLFEIKQAEVPNLPELKDPTTLNVRYPLIPPYCFAVIKWDQASGELVYTIEEPVLTSEEQKILKTLESGIGELVNLSFISSKDKYTVLSYLEKNIKVLLTELSIKVSMDTFLKIMYYIYRDFVGMNDLEPLMNDYFIEDIECNGINTPVYVVHRKYRNIRTNLIYKDLTTMTTFVEKIAQKCGRYVSYAEPLLDGTLPDGSIGYNEPVIYKEDGIVRVSKIGEVIDKFYDLNCANKPINVNNLEICAFDKDYKINWKKVDYVYRHKIKNNLLDLKLEFGRNIKLTECHSIFILTKEGVVSRRTDELKLGDYVVLPSKIPENDVIREINLVTEFSKSEYKNKILIGNVPSHIYSMGKKEIYEYYRQNYKKPNQAYYEHKNKKILPLGLSHLIGNIENCSLTTTSTKHIPVILKADLDLMRLLGLYIAEGWLNHTKQRGIIFSLNKNEIDLIETIRRSAKKCFNTDIYVEKDKDNSVKVRINSLIAYIIMKDILKVSLGAKNKRVPNLVFNVSKRLQNEFIKYWHLGDYGTTTSKRLAEDISYLGLFNEDIAAFYKSDSKITKIKGREIKTDCAYYSNFYARDTNHPYPNMIPIEAFNSLCKTHIRFQNIRINRNRIIKILSDPRYARFENKDFSNKKFVLEWEKRGFIKNNKLTDKGEEVVKELQIVRKLVDSDFSFAKITKITKTQPTTDYVYDFSIKNDENFVAGIGGICCHNSRVNATYTTDVSSRGPTFSIRKFTSEPWSPLQLVQKGTTSFDILAYAWMCIEYEHSFMVVGGTGSGKTSLLNALAFFIPPQARIVSIEDSVTGDSELIIKNRSRIIKTTIAKITKEVNKKRIDINDLEVLTLDKDYKIKFTKPSSFIMHQSMKDIYKVRTSTGKTIEVTKDHSLFTLTEAGLKEVKPEELEIGQSFIATPRKLPINIKGVHSFDLTQYFDVFNDDFLCGKPLTRFFKQFNNVDLRVGKSRYAWWKRNNIIKIAELRKRHFSFTEKEKEGLFIKSKNITKLPVILILDKNMLEFIGLWLGDGSHDNYNKNRTIISDNEKEAIQVYKKIGEQYNIKTSVMDDNWSWAFNSTIFYKFTKYVLELDGNAKTKKIPTFVYNLNNEQLKSVISGYFGADGSVPNKYEITASSQSQDIINGMQDLLLRFSIVSRQGIRRKDGCIDLRISSYENLNNFKQIGFVHSYKNKRLKTIGHLQSNHTCSDVIPFYPKMMISVDKTIKNYNYDSSPGREYLKNKLKMLKPKLDEKDYIRFSNILNSDILWDKVVSITKLPRKNRYIYDISVPETEKFICQNIILHNTRELQLSHENWLPSVSRAGVGISNLLGQKYGEVSLFDLLRASFRQRPDYIIVGEIRGKEAYVLFQAFASGHPGCATMHAENVDTMIRRLETPPINLSGSMLMTLSSVFTIEQTKVRGKDVRKVTSVDEIIEVQEHLKGSKTNNVFKWDPAAEAFRFSPNSYVFDKIATHYGFKKEDLMREYQVRVALLRTLYNRGIVGFKEVQDVVHEYYKAPQQVLRRYGLVK